MIRLPKWVLTNPRPSIYDSESATAIEMTAKLYGAMSELVDEYNLFTDKVNAEIEKFEKSTDADIELFKVSIRQEFEDFIGIVEMKLSDQDKEISNAVKYLQDNLTYSIRQLIAEMRETGELNGDIVAVLDDIEIEMTSLSRSVEQRPVYCDCSNTLKENVDEGTSMYMTMGYREPDDGGSGMYVIKEVESTENLSPASIVINENKVADLICNGKVNVKQFGAYGNSNDGTHNDAEPINRAIEYAHHHGCLVEIPPETFLISSPIILYSEVEVAGMSRNKSIIKLHDNANCNMIETVHFNELIAGQTEGVYQPYRITLRNLKLDGNMANNENGHGICAFASACTFENLFITRIPQNGMYLKVSDTLITTIWDEATKQASVVNNVDIYSCGEHGIYGDNFHDTFYNNLVVASASQKEDNTYDAVHLVNGSGGRFVHFHGWNASDEVGPRARYIMYIEGNQTIEVSTSHIEGGRTSNLYIGSNGMFENCRFYASYGEAIIEIAGSINTFYNCRFQEKTDVNTKCVKFDSASRLNRFDALIPTALKFADDSESGGCNSYRLSWWGQVTADAHCVENLQATSSLDVMANYTSWEGVATVFPNMASFKRNEVDENAIAIFNNNADNLQLRNYDYVLVKDNASAKGIVLNSNKQPIGKKVVVRNMSSALITYYFDTETTLDGTVRGSWYASSQEEVILLKIADKEWVTLLRTSLGGSAEPEPTTKSVYVFNDDEASLQLGNYDYVVVKSNANAKGIITNSNSQPVGREVLIRNNSNAVFTYYFNSGTTLNGEAKDSWYVSANSSLTLLKIADKDWISF